MVLQNNTNTRLKIFSVCCIATPAKQNSSRVVIVIGVVSVNTHKFQKPLKQQTDPFIVANEMHQDTISIEPITHQIMLQT